jgi:hypothetical protein
MPDLSKRMIRSQLVTVDGITPQERHKQIFKILSHVSKQIWDYNGYAGTIRPWHDLDNPDFWWWKKPQRSSLSALFDKLAKHDIPYWAYFVILLSVSDYQFWERPALLAVRPDMWGMIKKLREHVGSAKAMDRLAQILVLFIQLQVQQSGSTNLTAKRVMAFEDVSYALSKYAKNKTLVGYHRLHDRIQQIETAGGMDFELWMREKYKSFEKKILEQKDDPRWQSWRVVTLKNIVKPGELDPKMSDLMIRLEDPWVEIRDYLGLSYACQFPDGYIPKGWFIDEFDADSVSEIVAISGEGFYYRKDGMQRKGIRHYANNKYFLIKCTPDNFKFFIDEWKHRKLVSAVPTWQEYSAWAAYPGVWNSDGVGLQTENGMIIKVVKWRGSKNRKLELLGS